MNPAGRVDPVRPIPLSVPAKSPRRAVLKWLALWFAILVVLLLAAVGVLVANAWWDARVSPDIEGRIVIYGLTAPEPGESCETGWWRYVDIYDGAGAWAHDPESLKPLGNGNIDEGVWDNGACVFPFSIPNVDVAESYAIAIGAFGLRQRTISREELEQHDWRVQFVFGTPPRAPVPAATPGVA